MIRIYNKQGVVLDTKNKYCTENIQVAIDDTDLKPENIVEGKWVLGVTGTAKSLNSLDSYDNTFIREDGSVFSYDDSIVLLNVEQLRNDNVDNVDKLYNGRGTAELHFKTNKTSNSQMIYGYRFHFLIPQNSNSTEFSITTCRVNQSNPSTMEFGNFKLGPLNQALASDASNAAASQGLFINTYSYGILAPGVYFVDVYLIETYDTLDQDAMIRVWGSVAND